MNVRSAHDDALPIGEVERWVDAQTHHLRELVDGKHYELHSSWACKPLPDSLHGPVYLHVRQDKVNLLTAQKLWVRAWTSTANCNDWRMSRVLVGRLRLVTYGYEQQEKAARCDYLQLEEYGRSGSRSPYVRAAVEGPGGWVALSL
jgi:hypothetical protein